MPQLTLPGEKPHAFQNEEDIQPIATPIPISSGTPRPWVIHQGATPGGSGEKVTLRSVSEIPQKYQCVFSEFAYFNIVQSKVLDSVLYTDQPLVLCAPTGSGKTVVFELAIVRLLLRMEASGPITNGKVVYMAPVKALCSERCADWSAKFGPLGLQCTELTGDTLTDEYYALQSAHVVLTTPEKWDSMTRRWKDNRSLVKLVRLFLVDEVHLLNDASRGATMEAVVTRMKTVRSAIYRESESQTSSAAGLRFIAVSATIPNAEDIAEWLGSDDSTAISYKMGEEVRPVKLTKHVLGFPCIESWSEFRFDLSLNYKLLRIIQKYSDGKPTLVQVERKLQDICMSVLRSLADCRLVDMDDDAFALKSTESGRLMARYYVAFETMASFHGFTGRFGLEDLVRAVAGCQEFRDIQLRANEKRALNNLNQHKTDLCIRCVICVYQSIRGITQQCEDDHCCCLAGMVEFLLTQPCDDPDCCCLAGMVEFLLTQPCEDALHTFYCAVLLDKSLRAKLWENSKHVARQLEKIGPTLSNHLVNAGITSFEKISATNPRELEMVVNRHPPFGSIVKEAVSLLPKYELSVDQVLSQNSGIPILQIYLCDSEIKNISEPQRYKLETW
ncbi:PREDICTED: probable ATP-dependent DNA helicase HFM1 [Priapulus caudatus]|uniref:Probable ATP-dependent DNA helicase HFM1 n=1 Tax=Priapulus caudatus TaxID=37621 RepID=A0ABM1ECC9_PRICU|nr:PREDICTED: probable ATP-dependent DNA helicase HFM1 [Priapulus caudatus]